MQPRSLTTVAAAVLSVFIIWRLISSSQEELDDQLKVEEKDVLGGGGSQQGGPPARLSQHVADKVVVPYEHQSYCGFADIAKNSNQSSSSFTMSRSVGVVERCQGNWKGSDAQTADRMVLYKDIQLPAPAFYEMSYSTAGNPPKPKVMVKPGDLPETVHYVWCGAKEFKFENYLSILSTVKLLNPHKVIFHYHDLPIYDAEWYNSWFVELKQSLPSLELLQSDTEIPCGGHELLDLLLQLVTSVEGGVYVGETTLMTRLPKEWRELSAAVHFLPGSQPDDAKLALLMSKPGLTVDQLKADTLQAIQKSSTVTHYCRTVDEFNSAAEDGKPPCVVMTSSVTPHDVMTEATPTSSLARWLYYGVPEPVTSQQSSQQAAPRVGHMVNFKSPGTDWPFYSYLSVLSALHIAGLSHMYVYGEQEPKGQWWEGLRGREQVTFVAVDPTHVVYQQPVKDSHHQQDVLSYYILWKYGGVYMDADTIWNNPIPDGNWQYPAVTSLDTSKGGGWPGYMNVATLMAKPGASFCRHMLDSFRYYIDTHTDFNSARMAYRMYEQHPSSVFLDSKLQFSTKGKLESVTEGELSQYAALYFKWPDTPHSLESLAALKSGSDAFADIGRKILEKSGRSAELDQA